MILRKKTTERLSRPGLRLRGMSLSGWISLGFIVLLALACILAPLIAQDPLATEQLQHGTASAAPSLQHWFGQDLQGRDIFSRILYGGRISLSIGLGAAAIALVAGAIVGAAAATLPKWGGGLVMRILDVIMAFPGIALAALFVTIFGGSIPSLILAIGFVYMPMVARVVRANVLEQYSEDYVAFEKVIGARTWWIVTKHVIVNCAAPVLVFATLLVADSIVFEASLSFVGAGIRPPTPSWGNVIQDGRAMMFTGGWWATVFPGLFILLTVICLNIIAERVTDAMANPALRRVKKRKDAPVITPQRTAQLIKEAELAIAGDAEKTEHADAGAAVTTGAASGEEPVRALTLDEHLEQLREVELARAPRKTYTAKEAPLLEVRNLSIRFPERYGDIPIVDDVSFTVRPGETMALVGESGCGKSITSLAIMGLLPRSAKVDGQILFNGVDLLTLSPKQRNALRGHEMSMIYQDALSSLNPSMKIRAQLKQLTKRGGTRTAEELLTMVGLDPQRTLSSYPHELSGGQRQRVLIAMALTRDPKLIVADEPTTALDVTVQKQVVELLDRLREDLGFAMVFVSHDLALVASLAHRVTVMYAGQVVETAPTRSLLLDPRHEYTRGLLGAVLSIEDQADILHQIPGTVPSPGDFPSGDRFAPRSLDPNADPNIRPELAAIPGSEEHLFAARVIPTPQAALVAEQEEDEARTAPANGGRR
ncbi:dipeptide/oligopeptide/nickel ABC transporter permease/ATP-binding protein [Rathayibacter sp. CAU 1779]